MIGPSGDCVVTVSKNTLKLTERELFVSKYPLLIRIPEDALIEMLADQGRNSGFSASIRMFKSWRWTDSKVPEGLVHPVEIAVLSTACTRSVGQTVAAAG